MASRLTVPEYVAGVRAADRAVLGRAFTLMESTRPQDRDLARQVLEALQPYAGGSIRVGLSGVPGVGKSTFLEAMGCRLIDRGHRVAVLAVDPTSDVSGGSILGDKTRMGELSRRENAFVRPSPTSGRLGGVAGATRECLLVCEAAGFDVVFIETVGVGQSETAVAGMVDSFLVLMLAGAGDDLQGIKRGILEVADVLAIQKADGDNRDRAQASRRELGSALRLLRGHGDWAPPVLACSALTGDGLDEVWAAVLSHRDHLQETGQLESKRSKQLLAWMHHLVEQRILDDFRRSTKVAAAELGELVRRGKIWPAAAADALLARFEGGDHGGD